MTAFELIDRMSYEEMQLWAEWDQNHISQTDYQFAQIMAKLDKIAGNKKANVNDWLPKLKGPRKTIKRKSIAQIKAEYDLAAARSQRNRNG